MKNESVNDLISKTETKPTPPPTDEETVGVSPEESREIEKLVVTRLFIFSAFMLLVLLIVKPSGC